MDAGYSGTPLWKKLGARPGAVVALVGAPDGFVRSLPPLPQGATLERRAGPSADLTVWFVERERDLLKKLPAIVRSAERNSPWIAWPKRASGAQTDLSETNVRAHGLAAGLVDFKVCAIDHYWSGLRFAVQRKT